VKRFFTLLLMTLLITMFAPGTTARANTRAGNAVFFPETGHTLAYSFRAFFDTHGGLPMLGFPLTEVFMEHGLPVQYFERTRLEWHAEEQLVLAGHLGRWAAQGHDHDPAFAAATSFPEASFFAETSHNLGGQFRYFWQTHGGLDMFGFPISEELREVNQQDGQSYIVQYFERARFELHPELPAGQQVLLGHLGRQFLAASPAPDEAVAPVTSADQAWNAVRPTHLSIPRIGVNTDVVETGFTGNEWDVPRYTATHYWPISAFPGTAGNMVIAGHVGYRDIIFNKLPNVRHGDEIFVTVGGQQRRYIVRDVLTLLPTDTWVLAPTPNETLTLITCVPIGVYTHRLIVRAEPG
jgi:LPXTG-site transpeptidase (sortase) family protein